MLEPIFLSHNSISSIGLNFVMICKYSFRNIKNPIGRTHGQYMYSHKNVCESNYTDGGEPMKYAIARNQHQCYNIWKFITCFR
jgi:hypothetical protein